MGYTERRRRSAGALRRRGLGGGGHGGVDSTAFSFAGAPGAGSSGSWVRETTALTLGSAAVLGGQGAGTGGGGGGGASHAVGSGYGLAEGEALNVPCQAEGFCARNWLSSADTDQPKVVITFWQNQGADPLIPTDHETIDTDQPSLVFKGTGASSGIHYLLWTVPSGLLGEGQTYDWYVTDQSGKTLQAPQSFTIATDTTPSGLSQGWTLYVRSMDDLDTSLPADLQPLDNQLVPKVSTGCACNCGQVSSTTDPTPELLGDTYPNCTNYSTTYACSCNYTLSPLGPRRRTTGTGPSIRVQSAPPAPVVAMPTPRCRAAPLTSTGPRPATPWVCRSLSG